jgi:fermentation-respiration switch protein FrsA (DUF1100 family)
MRDVVQRRSGRLALVVGLLSLACMFAHAGLASVIYHPEYGSHRAPAGLQKLPDGHGGEIAVVALPNPQARFTLWFFHGNAEDLGDIEGTLLALRAAGFAVFAYDYPGYGFSSGKPSEASLNAAARVARRYLRETLKVPPERTLLYGRSLGGGPAMQMAVEERTGGLVLQSTFMSVFRVATRWRILPFDQFENLRKIARLNCPVLVMHGREDEVIAFRHGEALFAAAREPKRRLWVPLAHHNDLVAVAGESYWRSLREFSELCAQTVDAKR